MRKMRYVVAAAALCCCLMGFARVEWMNTRYDFGTWPEKDGLREGKARFVNKGDTAVIIRHVRPSCGCTGVEYTQSPVAPGDTGVISFNYNPKGRPGHFEKTIRVFLDSESKPEVIHISGTVVGDESSLLHRYPVALGPLRLSGYLVDFGDVEWGTSRHTFISAYNASTSQVMPVLDRVVATDETLPVEVTITPKVVAPGQIQTISVYMNGSMAPQPGPLQTTQTICVGDTCMDLLFRSKVLPPSASATAEQTAVAPLADITPEVVELGNVKRGKRVKMAFEIANTGASELRVQRMYSQFPGLTIKKYPMHLSPGKKGKVEAEIDTRIVQGDVISGNIEMICNDLMRPVQRVRFVGRMK